jgi:hypothetical protein
MTLQYIPSEINIYKESKMETFIKVVGLAIVGFIAIVVLGLLMSLPVMWLWNGCLVAAIPGIKTIGWTQAWGIMILSGILFKNSSSTSSSN